MEKKKEELTIDEARVVRPVRINKIVNETYEKSFESALFFCIGTRSPNPIVNFGESNDKFKFVTHNLQTLLTRVIKQ